MFANKVAVELISAEQTTTRAPIRWIDNFAMRNFTNDAIFDDTLPIADGLLEVGYRVPTERLQAAMFDWFRRKGYLRPGEHLVVRLLVDAPTQD